jgi:hypothetical protein
VSGVLSAAGHHKPSAGYNEEHAVFARNEHRVIPTKDSRRRYSIEGLSLQDSHLPIRTFGDTESSVRTTPHATVHAVPGYQSDIRQHRLLPA